MAARGSAHGATWEGFWGKGQRGEAPEAGVARGGTGGAARLWAGVLTKTLPACSKIQETYSGHQVRAYRLYRAPQRFGTASSPSTCRFGVDSAIEHDQGVYLETAAMPTQGVPMLALAAPAPVPHRSGGPAPPTTVGAWASRPTSRGRCPRHWDGGPHNSSVSFVELSRFHDSQSFRTCRKCIFSGSVVLHTLNTRKHWDPIGPRQMLLRGALVTGPTQLIFPTSAHGHTYTPACCQSPRQVSAPGAVDVAQEPVRHPRCTCASRRYDTLPLVTRVCEEQRARLRLRAALVAAVRLGQFAVVKSSTAPLSVLVASILFPHHGTRPGGSPAAAGVIGVTLCCGVLVLGHLLQLPFWAYS